MNKILCSILAIAFILGIMAPLGLAQDEGSKKVLKEGLLGAATGAIASSASGGNAGKGALIGAGVNVVGGALLDTLTSPSQPAPAPQPAQVAVPVHEVVQAQPVVPSLYQQGYEAGYQKGFDAGYEKGYSSGLEAAKR